ncbi:hypothetical protein BJV78DRAFT_490569 [Lactifluus subvellereus]|nr:hypothetical protein BJV78DRAFT_490569 [Lactifluus subvellereus]
MQCTHHNRHVHDPRKTICGVSVSGARFAEKRDGRSTQLLKSSIHLFLRYDYYHDCRSPIRKVLMAIARRRVYNFRSILDGHIFVHRTMFRMSHRTDSFTGKYVLMIAPRDRCLVNIISTVYGWYKKLAGFFAPNRNMSSVTSSSWALISVRPNLCNSQPKLKFGSRSVGIRGAFTWCDIDTFTEGAVRYGI